jgi:hypothetical protein
MHAVQSIAIKRVPPRCHPVEQCGMARQPASLPAIRSTATFLAHAMARSIQSDNCFSMVGPRSRAGQPVIRIQCLGLTAILSSRTTRLRAQRAVFKRFRNWPDIRSRNTAVAALPYVNQFTHPQKFFLCRYVACWHFCEVPTVSENVRSSGKTGSSARGQNGEMDLKRTWLSGTRRKPFVVKSSTGVVNN